MEDKRILTVQDISCVGQCSLTVALPLLSACGIETAVLPTAVLSTHTVWQGVAFRDLTEDIPAISAHWQKENIKFDAIYSGYLGSEQQINYVINLMKTALNPGAVKIVDPAFADNGKLYKGFSPDFPQKMQNLLACADIIIPNLTEACLITQTPYKSEYGREYIENLLQKLQAITGAAVVLTGVSFSAEATGIACFCGGKAEYYTHAKIPKLCHGTGDIYASVLTGAYLRGFSLLGAAKLAADFTYRCIANTAEDANHWYGVKFEKEIPHLLELLQGGTVKWK